LKNRIFGGYVISMLPKLGEMLAGIHVDLRVIFGPLSTFQLALRGGRKIFVFGGLTPKPKVEIEN